MEKIAQELPEMRMLIKIFDAFKVVNNANIENFLFFEDGCLGRRHVLVIISDSHV
jgi:hypothetical protein